MYMHLTRAWVEIDLGALRRNAAALATRAAALLPMVKADAYGLGALPVVRALEHLDPWGFGVATIDEGIELRRAGIERRILVFTPVRRDDLPEMRRARLTPALGRAADVAHWVSIGGGAWHLAIDTGMSRAGAVWSEIDGMCAVVQSSPPEGAFTHFHSADLDDGSREEQERRFERALARLPLRPGVLHAENSAALARVARSRWDLARPGIFLYGAGSGARALVAPEPVVSLRARVVDLRIVTAGDGVSYGATWRADGERRIATLAVGYADGYRRSLGNRGSAIVRGRVAPVVGVVTMDMTMIDVTDAPCEVGDVATLIGRDGDVHVELEDVARAASLSPYEILTGLRSRLERAYRGES